MRLLFVADGRSPIARNWIRYFLDGSHEVHLLSTFGCTDMDGLASLHVVPVAFSGVGGQGKTPRKPLTSARTIGLRTFIRHWLGPATIRRSARYAQRIITDIEPDLVHAMRIPFEGALAARANPPAPLLISVWGNDFTLHAAASPMMRGLTRDTMARAAALHTDNRYDRELAAAWGFPDGRPGLVLPGNGGVRRDIFHAGDSGTPGHPELARVLQLLPSEGPTIVNPRGFRAYVRNDTFFRAVPEILRRNPSAAFLCPNMAGERAAERWRAKVGAQAAVHLLPRLDAADLALVFRRSSIMLSPSEHDGTPNTLLEAMACGSFPAVGDLPSLREWIEDGVNGILLDPSNPAELASAVSRALDDQDLRAHAAEQNVHLIAERADYAKGMPRARAFYKQLVA